MLGIQKTKMGLFIAGKWKWGEARRTVAMDMARARLRRKSLKIARLIVDISWIKLDPVGITFYFLLSVLKIAHILGCGRTI